MISMLYSLVNIQNNLSKSVLPSYTLCYLLLKRLCYSGGHKYLNNSEQYKKFQRDSVDDYNMSLVDRNVQYNKNNLYIHRTYSYDYSTNQSTSIKNIDIINIDYDDRDD